MSKETMHSKNYYYRHQIWGLLGLYLVYCSRLYLFIAAAIVLSCTYYSRDFNKLSVTSRVQLLLWKSNEVSVVQQSVIFTQNFHESNMHNYQATRDSIEFGSVKVETRWSFNLSICIASNKSPIPYHPIKRDSHQSISGFIPIYISLFK